jgi:hypothetical protein
VVIASGIAGVGLLSGIVYAQKHHAPTGPDAFLHYQVDSTDELVEALRENPQLRRSYARQFGVPENRIIAFVKDALVPYRLPQSRVVTDYGITRSGRIYCVRERMRKGTKVWATRSGVPILKWACANPLTKVLPGLQLAAAPRPVRPHTSLHAPTAVPVVKQVASSELPPAELNPVPVTPTIDTAAIVPSIPVTGVAAGSIPSIGPTGSTHIGPGPLPYLIPIAIIIGISSGHGGHSGTPPGGGGTGPAVPEPASLPLLFAAGLPALFCARRRLSSREA